MEYTHHNGKIQNCIQKKQHFNLMSDFFTCDFQQNPEWFFVEIEKIRCIWKLQFFCVQFFLQCVT